MHFASVIKNDQEPFDTDGSHLRTGQDVPSCSFLKASKTFTMETSTEKPHLWVDLTVFRKAISSLGLSTTQEESRSPFEGDWCPPPQKHEQVDSSDPLSFVQKS